MYERDGHTDTHIRTPHDHIGRACIASRGNTRIARLQCHGRDVGDRFASTIS